VHCRFTRSTVRSLERYKNVHQFSKYNRILASFYEKDIDSFILRFLEFFLEEYLCVAEQVWSRKTSVKSINKRFTKSPEICIELRFNAIFVTVPIAHLIVLLS
jgi:hypothetical protein